MIAIDFVDYANLLFGYRCRCAVIGYGFLMCRPPVRNALRVRSGDALEGDDGYPKIGRHLHHGKLWRCCRERQESRATVAYSAD